VSAGEEAVKLSPTVKDLLWIPVNLFQALWMVGFIAVLFIPTMLTGALTGNREALFSMGRAFWGPWNLRMGFSSLTVEDRHKLPPPGQPYVMMMNHQSMVDILVAWMLLPVGPHFVAKKALLFVPLVGQFMWLTGMIAVDRSNRHAAIAALRRAQDVIKGGHVLSVFPEGTRTRDGRIAPFKKGVFVVAQKAGAPIVPIAIEGPGLLVPRTGWKPRPVALKAKVGDPIDPTGLSREEVMRRVRDALITMNEEIGGPGGDRDSVVAVEAQKVLTPQPAAA
jgi:1-acyl-sn-glycerol-3-phosphate acyltransferase